MFVCSFYFPMVSPSLSYTLGLAFLDDMLQTPCLWLAFGDSQLTAFSCQNLARHLKALGADAEAPGLCEVTTLLWAAPSLFSSSRPRGQPRPRAFRSRRGSVATRLLNTNSGSSCGGAGRSILRGGKLHTHVFIQLVGNVSYSVVFHKPLMQWSACFP